MRPRCQVGNPEYAPWTAHSLPLGSTILPSTSLDSADGDLPNPLAGGTPLGPQIFLLRLIPQGSVSGLGCREPLRSCLRPLHCSLVPKGGCQAFVLVLAYAHNYDGRCVTQNDYGGSLCSLNYSLGAFDNETNIWASKVL